MTRDLRRTATMVAAVAAAAVCSALLTGARAAATAGPRAPAAARSAALGGTWGAAEEVPGSAALNQSGLPDRLGVVRLGGQLQRRRVLPRRLRPSRRSWSARSAAPGAPPRRCPACGPQRRRRCCDHLGVVRVGGQLQRRRDCYADASGDSRRSWSARRAAPGAPPRRCPARRPSTRAERRDHLGVVRLGGQLQRRRVLRGRLRPGRRSWSVR